MTSDSPIGLFSQVKDPEAFQATMGSADLLNEGRKIIDHVDPKIVSYMSSFALSASPPKSITLPKKVIDKLDGAPEDFLIAIARYDHFNGMSEDMREKNLVTLAGFVAQRFTAISLIALSKKMNGETSPFHAERHANVLNIKGEELRGNGGNADLGQKAFCDFMQAGCIFQAAYMTDNGKSAEPVRARLQKIGINPL